MKNCNIKEILSNNKGITLIALIITIVIMLIIVGISINVGTESLNSTRLQGFYMQLEIIQKRVDDIATTNESYIGTNGDTVYLMKQGTAYTNLTSNKQQTLNSILQKEGGNLEASSTSFRYFTVEQLNKILGLSNMDYDVFIDFETRTIIAEKGINIAGKNYHILNNKIYFVKYNESSNEFPVKSLKFSSPTIFGGTYYPGVQNTISNSIEDNVIYNKQNNYKIKVSPAYEKEPLNVIGVIKYKKSSSKYWETSDNLEMVISDLTEYDVVYEDNYNNSVSVTINVSLNINGEVIINY